MSICVAQSGSRTSSVIVWFGPIVACFQSKMCWLSITSSNFLYEAMPTRYEQLADLLVIRPMEFVTKLPTRSTLPSQITGVLVAGTLVGVAVGGTGVGVLVGGTLVGVGGTRVGVAVGFGVLVGTGVGCLSSQWPGPMMPLLY